MKNGGVVPVAIKSGKACHSERSAKGAKSKNLRIPDAAMQLFGAKILRLPIAALRVAQDDILNEVTLGLVAALKYKKALENSGMFDTMIVPNNKDTVYWRIFTIGVVYPFYVHTLNLIKNASFVGMYVNVLHIDIVWRLSEFAFFVRLLR